jgi:hypothetical protein
MRGYSADVDITISRESWRESLNKLRNLTTALPHKLAKSATSIINLIIHHIKAFPN